jgi:hypothetical protein
MSNKSKRVKHRNTTTHSKQNTEKKNMADDVKIHGAIEVHPSQQSTEDRKTERKQDEPYKKSTQGFEHASVIISVIGLIITGLYLAATTGILIETKRTNKQVAENIKLDQRAWLGIENIFGEPVQFPETGKPFGVKVILRNSGRTPAKNVYMRNEVYPLQSAPNVNRLCPIARQLEESRSVLAPNATYTIPLQMTDGQPLGVGWEQDFSTKGGVLYVYGCILYEDIFKREQWLTYCGIAGKTGFHACKEYNDTGDLIATGNYET